MHNSKLVGLSFWFVICLLLFYAHSTCAETDHIRAFHVSLRIRNGLPHAFCPSTKKNDTNSYIVINNDNKSRFHNYCTLCATHSWHICSFAIQPVNVIPLGWGSMHIFTCCSFCRYYFYENAQRFLFTFVQALSYNGVRVCACMALAIKMYVSKRNEMNKKKNCTAAAFFFDTKLQLN